MSVNAKIEGDEIVIRIPIEALPTAAEIAWENTYGESGLYVDDLDEFAKEFLNYLLAENEIGDTLLHVAFDKAVINATEQGAFGIADRNEPD